MSPAGWRRRAVCAAPGVDPETVFPVKGGSAKPAKRICARCPVRVACLEDALDTPTLQDEHGIRGGTTPAERRVLRRIRRCAA